MFNNVKMKSCIFLFLLIISFNFISCKNQAQEEKIKHQVFETKLPTKFEVVFFNAYESDSAYVHLFLPQKFNLISSFNNPISLQHTYWSERGGNVSKAANFFLKNDKFSSGPNNIKIFENETLELELYTRFKKIISNSELKELEVFFNTKFEKGKIYDKEMTSSFIRFLNKKIPHKGFIRFTLYNDETKKHFFHNVPLNF